MKYSFCPKCGGKLGGEQHPVCSSCGFVFYQNAKPTASFLLENDEGDVLLVRRAVEPFKGMWDTPGGFCEQAEHPEDAAKREAKEELGVDVELTGLIGIFMDQYGSGGDSTMNVFYTGKIIGGDIQTADDVDAYEWFPKSRLPRVAFENGRNALDTLIQKSEK